MDTIFMNSRNSKTSDPCKLLLNLYKNIKKSYKNNRFKILGPKWNEEFQLPDESYSVYFEYILKNMEKKDR